MTTYFFDTSALGKRYIPETGTRWVRSLLDPQSGHYIVISALAEVEFVSILARRLRSGILNQRDFNFMQQDFLWHVQREYRVIRLHNNVLRYAQRLLLHHSLRSLDALHLASALVAEQQLGLRPEFVCSDQGLLQAAQAEGFTTDDPLLHP